MKSSHELFKIEIFENCTPDSVQLSINIRPTEDKVAATPAKVGFSARFNGYEQCDVLSNALQDAEICLDDPAIRGVNTLNGNQSIDSEESDQRTFSFVLNHVLPSIETNIHKVDKRIAVVRRTLKLLDETLEQTPDSVYEKLPTLIGVFLLRQKLADLYNYLLEEPQDFEIQQVIEEISSRLHILSERIKRVFIDPNIDPMGFDLIQKLRHLFALGGWNTEKNKSETERSGQDDNIQSIRKRPLSQVNQKTEEQSIQIKYRRVDNTFPKYMPNDSDEFNFKSMAEKCSLPTRHKSDSNGEPHSYNPFPTQARRSIFEMPQTTQIRVRNTNARTIVDLCDDEVNEVSLFSTRTGARTKSTGRADLMNARSMLSDALRVNTNGYGVDFNYVRPSSSMSSAVDTRLNGHGPNWFEMATDNVVMHEEDRGERKQYLNLINNLSLYDRRPPQESPQRQHKKPVAPPPLQRVAQSGDEWLRGLITHKPKDHEQMQMSASRNEFNKLIEQNIGMQPKSQATEPIPQLERCVSVQSDSPSISLSSCSTTSNLTPSNSETDLGNAQRDVDVIDLDDSESDEKPLDHGVNKSKMPATKASVPPPLCLVQTLALQQRIQSCSYFADDYESKFSKKHDRLRQEKYRMRDLALKEAEKSTEIRRAYEQDVRQSLSKLRIIHKPIFILDSLPVSSEKEVEFVPLTEQHLQRYQELIHGPGNQVLVSKFSLNITRNDISTLVGNCWLNDEVINFYMNLLTDRSERKADKLPSVYAMNTFFVPRLLQNGHGAVRRWTRKVDLFNKDIIPVPVHVGGVHWCMAIIHMKNKTIRYYDSMGKPNQPVLDALAQYLCDESMDKRKKPFDASDFAIENVANVPYQMNGSDCGVFSCMFAEYITRNKPLTFTQDHMEYFRKKMVLEICSGELWM